MGTGAAVRGAPCSRSQAQCVFATKTSTRTRPKMADRAKALRGKHLKVPLQRGFSLMDWMQLCSRAKDLAQRRGRPLRPIPMSEVRRHSTEFDCWSVLRGKVYNLTPYLHYHPGSAEELMRGAGRDCTSLFDKYHRWVNADNMLQACALGWLDNAAPDLGDGDSDDGDDGGAGEGAERMPAPPPCRAGEMHWWGRPGWWTL